MARPWHGRPGNREEPVMEPVEIEAKTLIQKSKPPLNDYVINP
ncbi:hypothetical protein PV726_43535 [Streptomyces europaeiscabiei]|nr:hypothetical protein [Streptomyces europaeiscabiei]MDX3696996.1 hypothetical protein [Streptomyces europaeiscabiei]